MTVDTCRYRAADHTYWMGETQVPGVTSLLAKSGAIQAKFFTQRARDHGLAVHAACEALDKRTGGPIPTTVLGELQAYRALLRDCRIEHEAIEEGRIHTGLGFGGRPDRICRRFLGAPGVLELKTGQSADWHGVQLAGYQLLYPTGARWVAYLKPNGRYDLRQCVDAGDYDRFYAALAAWKNGG